MKGLRNSMGTEEYSSKVFKKVFHDDIEHLRVVPELWKSRKAPISLELAKLQLKNKKNITEEDQQVWTVDQCAQIFVEWYDSIVTKCFALRNQKCQ
jgi:ubiquitin-like 1-activating enzyme E1 B